jgi:CRP/FNR family transcriptional regulator, cyclic AMP receptor protein
MFRTFDPRIEELQNVPVFAACTRKELDAIARLTDEVRFPDGSVLMQEGRSGRECFIVVDGEALVTMRGREIARAVPGDIVGEMALLEDEPRCATVTALGPLRAIVMTRQTFTAVLDASPGVARRILRELAHRLRKVQSRTRAA